MKFFSSILVWHVVALIAIGRGGDLSVQAKELIDPFIQKLTSKEKKNFLQYQKALNNFEIEKKAFWKRVQKKRNLRRRKVRSGQPLRDSDYISGFPPRYNGPKLSHSLVQKWSIYKRKHTQKKWTPKKNPPLSQYLNAAKKHYQFIPERIPEIKFKARYALEAIRLGLSSHQVVRVYALETGGYGTADMQAGVHPVSGDGNPISSALGYAQLLAANSISELVRNGEEFIQRLQTMSKKKKISKKRSSRLKNKIKSLRAMLRNARSVPNKWAHHMKHAKTSRGMGIHALNLDGDIGPWLQVRKLHELLSIAQKLGHQKLSGVQLEIMNLAGPRTGLEIMTSVGMLASTVNFFSRRGYERNTIVRKKTGKELLQALKSRMDENIKKKGSVEFYQIFKRILKSKNK